MSIIYSYILHSVILALVFPSYVSLFMLISISADIRPISLTLQVTSGSEGVSVIFFHYSFSHSRYCLIYIIIISLVLCRS